jgi:hypothetical protein
MSGKTALGPAASNASGAELSPIPLLDAIQDEGRTWQELARRYGVANPDPPWKVSLYAIFECLSAGGALPPLEWLPSGAVRAVPRSCRPRSRRRHPRLAFLRAGAPGRRTSAWAQRISATIT